MATVLFDGNMTEKTFCAAPLKKSVFRRKDAFCVNGPLEYDYKTKKCLKHIKCFK